MKSTILSCVFCLSAIVALAQTKKPARPATPHATPSSATQKHTPTSPPQHTPVAPAHHAPTTTPQPTQIVTYEQLVRTANVYTKQKNVQNEKQYSLSTHNKGGFRDENNHVMTLNDSTNAECKIHYTEIGNPNMEQVKNYGKSKKMTRLTNETEVMTLEEAKEAANAAAYILNAKGVQIISAPDGSHFWFVANDSIECSK
jgi:hypothetical protein